jgi:hypothetical protein
LIQDGSAGRVDVKKLVAWASGRIEKGSTEPPSGLFLVRQEVAVLVERNVEAENKGQ